MKSMAKVRQEQAQQKQFTDVRGKLTEAEIVNRATEDGVRQERDRVSALDKMLGKKTNLWFTSDNYEAVREKLKAYRAHQDGVARRLEESRKNDKEDFVDSADLESGQQCLNELRDAAQKYITEKMEKLNGKEPNSYEAQRIKAMKTVLNFAEDSLGLSDLETETVEQNTREAMEKEIKAAERNGEAATPENKEKQTAPAMLL